MLKLKRFIFFLVVPTAVIAMAEGIIYYSRQDLTFMEVLFSAIENTYRVFLLKPIISVYNAVSVCRTFPMTGQLITWIYAVIVILAPLTSLFTIILSVEALFISLGNSIFFSFKKKLFVIGDGIFADDVAKKYSKKYQVHYLMPSGTTDEHKLKLVKKRIIVTPIDYNFVDSACEDTPIRKASAVFLYFNDWYSNFENVVNFLDNIVRNREKATVKICFIDVPLVLWDTFNEIYRSICKKYGKSDTSLQLSYFRINEINARTFFEESPLPPQEDGKYHIIFNGFGNFGKAFFNELFIKMYNSGLQGTFEIFDKQISRQVGNLLFSEREGEITRGIMRSEPEENAVASFEIKSGKGVLQINLYETMVNDVKYADYVRDILKRQPPTDIFLCIDDALVSYNSFRRTYMNTELLSKTNFYFRVSPQTSRFYEAVKENSPSIKFLPDNLPDIDFLEDQK